MAELFTLKPLFPGNSEIDQIHQICSVLGSPISSNTAATSSSLSDGGGAGSDKFISPSANPSGTLEGRHSGVGGMVGAGINKSFYTSQNALNINIDELFGGGAWVDGIKLANSRGFKFPQTDAVSLAKTLPHVPAEALQLIADMLKYDPNSRPTAAEALQHPWFSDLLSESTAGQIDSTLVSLARNSQSNRNLIESHSVGGGGSGLMLSSDTSNNNQNRISLSNLNIASDKQLSSVPHQSMERRLKSDYGERDKPTNELIDDILNFEENATINRSSMKRKTSHAIVVDTRKGAIYTHSDVSEHQGKTKDSVAEELDEVLRQEGVYGRVYDPLPGIRDDRGPTGAYKYHQQSTSPVQNKSNSHALNYEDEILKEIEQLTQSNGSSNLKNSLSNAHSKGSRSNNNNINPASPTNGIRVAFPKIIKKNSLSLPANTTSLKGLPAVDGFIVQGKSVRVCARWNYEEIFILCLLYRTLGLSVSSPKKLVSPAKKSFMSSFTQPMNIFAKQTSAPQYPPINPLPQNSISQTGIKSMSFTSDATPLRAVVPPPAASRSPIKNNGGTFSNKSSITGGYSTAISNNASAQAQIQQHHNEIINQARTSRTSFFGLTRKKQ